jgi:hypothetical protein
MIEKIEKSKIILKSEDFIKIDHNGQEIIVNPYISLTTKTILFRNYIESYYKIGDIVNNFLDAKYSLILGIIDLCTNISLENIDIDALISSGVWDKIRINIKNYNDVTADLYIILKFISEKNSMEKSMSSTFDKLSESIINFMHNLDLSSDGINSLIKELNKETSEFDKKFKSESKNNNKLMEE